MNVVENSARASDRGWSPIAAEELAARLRARRHELGLSLRAAAVEVGVSAATLSRIESGAYLPERDNLFRLLDWLGLTRGEQVSQPHPPNAGTMEAIELHLRADKELSPADAEAIAQVVRLIYDRIRSGAR
jgi:transcriptional regulator with XRE-family HTH domain